MSAALRYLALVLLLWTATLATAGESLTGAQLAEQAVEKTATAHDQLNKTLLEEKEWRKDFNKRSWEWHLLSTKIIFTMVVGTVLFGLFLSYLQFTREERIQGGRKILAEPAQSELDGGAKAAPEATAAPNGSTH
jgi:hypothetical protein